jgi:hypothetical protein
MLGVRLRLGDQPISAAAIFNTQQDRAAAQVYAHAVDGAQSAGRPLTVEKIFLDPSVRIPSNRFMKSIWLATGLVVETDAQRTEWRLKNDQALPMREFARRQVDCLRLVRNVATELERDAMELDLPVGIGVADLGDRMYWIELCGTEAVIVIDPTVAAEISTLDPYLFSQVGAILGLRAGQRIRNFTAQVRNGPLIEDPVVDILSRLYRKARQFNAQQPHYRVHFEQADLQTLISAAHERDAAVARDMSETLTIGGSRGHRDQRSLRVALHTVGHPRRWGGQFAAAAYPIGDPSDVDVRIINDANVASPEELFERVFGSETDRNDFHKGPNHHVIAGLLGYEPDETELYR